MRQNILSKTGLSVMAIGLNLSAGAMLSSAATVTVCPSGCDYTAIQDAITNAVAGDTIQISAGTYTESGITVNKDLTLEGIGAGSSIVQAAAAEATATDRVFLIDTGVTATLKDMTIRYGNPNANGGGILNQGIMLTINNCTISHNRLGSVGTQRWGGGIYSTGSLTINNSTISHNTGDGTDQDGGGLFIDGPSAILILRDSIVSNNTDWNFGGGVIIYRAQSATIVNSTISYNTVHAGCGGGIYNEAPTDISFSTITGNSITDGGYAGGIYGAAGTVTIKNSIVAGNTCDTETGDDLVGFISTLGGNLIGDNTSVEATFPAGAVNANGDYVGTGASPIDPLLGPLADNGGPTQTFALLSQSPARDLATECTDAQDVTVTTDQRGYTRQTSNCDSGSYDHKAVNPDKGFLPLLYMIPIWKAAHDRMQNL